MYVMHGFTMKRRAAFNRMSSAFWKWSMIALAVVQVMIHVPVEMIVAVIPGSRSNEHTTRKPFRAVVAIRSAIVRRLFVVTVRTCGCGANLHRHLRRRCALARSQQKTRGAN